MQSDPAKRSGKARRCVMAIDRGLREKLVPGTRLRARYRGSEYGAEVIVGEDEKRRYRLEDGREFKSLSAAGSAVMDGIACNGWHFWNVMESEAEATTETAEKPARSTPPVNPRNRTKGQAAR
jgi:hypothetical protein